MTINSSFKPVAAFALACLITFPNVCDGRRFGGAGSRSSFGSSSRRSDSSYDRSQSNSSYNQPSSYSGKPSPPKTPTTNSNRSATKDWNNSRPRATKVSRTAAKKTKPTTPETDTTTTPATTKPATTAKTTKPTNKVDSKLAVAAKSSKLKYKDRAAAIAAFKAKNKDKYKTTFDAKPATRPRYIPSTYKRNGFSYDVTYSPRYRGYGYMYGSRWVQYDPFTDSANMNYLLWEKGYDYHGKPNWSPPAHVRAKRAGTYVPHYSRGRGGLGIAFFVGLVVIVFFIGGAAVIAGIAILASKSRTK